MAEKHKRKIFTAVKRALAKFGIVPIPDDDFLDMPARYLTLNAPFEALGAKAQPAR